MSKMFKKDYELIATAIKTAHAACLLNCPISTKERQQAIQNVITEVASQLATRFEMDNPNFNRKKFEAACAKEENIVFVE